MLMPAASGNLLVIVLSFATFWLLDRKANAFPVSGRLRLSGHPAVAATDLGQRPLAPLRGGRDLVGLDLGRSSRWPSSFFIFEINHLAASAPERQTVPAVKDAFFVLLYGILLIAAAAAGVHPWTHRASLALLDIARLRLWFALTINVPLQQAKGGMAMSGWRWFWALVGYVAYIVVLIFLYFYKPFEDLFTLVVKWHRL